jgi:hypothetical protein
MHDDRGELLVTETGRIRAHDAGLQDAQHKIRRPPAKHGAWRNVALRTVVAHGAALLINLRAHARDFGIGRRPLITLLRVRQKRSRHHRDGHQQSTKPTHQYLSLSPPVAVMPFDRD